MHNYSYVWQIMYRFDQVVLVSVLTHQDGGRLDDMDGLGQRSRHGSQLVPYLL